MQRWKFTFQENLNIQKIYLIDAVMNWNLFSAYNFFFFPASGLFQYDMITYTKVLWKVQRLMFVSVKSMAYLPVGNFKPFQFFLYIPK